MDTCKAAVKGVDRSKWKVGEVDIVLTKVVKEIPMIFASGE
jgi:hypothetical protein